MNRQQILQKVTQIVRELADDDSVVLVDGTTAEDVDAWDSLFHVKLMTAIITAFEIRLIGYGRGFAVPWTSRAPILQADWIRALKAPGKWQQYVDTVRELDESVPAKAALYLCRGIFYARVD
jgi:acyl carrier protein